MLQKIKTPLLKEKRIRSKFSIKEQKRIALNIQREIAFKIITEGHGLTQASLESGLKLSVVRTLDQKIKKGKTFEWEKPG